MKIDAADYIELIDAKCSIVPGGGGVVGLKICVVQRIGGSVQRDDCGLDGDVLSVLEMGFGETDGQTGIAGRVHIVGDDFADESVTTMEFESAVEVNVSVEGSANLIAGVGVFGIERVSE